MRTPRDAAARVLPTVRSEVLAGAAALLLLSLGLDACAPAATAPPKSSPAPTPAVVDYNTRAGSNRAAAAASLEISRMLYTDHVSFWEVYVKTTPLNPTPPRDPEDPAELAAQGDRVTAVDLIMASESGLIIKTFRNGGHDHEKQVMTGIAELLHRRFPRATFHGQIFYGETHKHAEVTYDGGVLGYNLLDNL